MFLTSKWAVSYLNSKDTLYVNLTLSDFLIFHKSSCEPFEWSLSKVLPIKFVFLRGSTYASSSTNQYHVTSRDVHVGLSWLLTPGGRAAMGAGAWLGAVAELGRNAAHSRICTSASHCTSRNTSSTSSSTSSTCSSHSTQGGSFKASKGTFGGHMLATQVLVSQLCMHCYTALFSLCCAS